MLFQQDNAPFGWAKELNNSYNDISIRIVTGNIADNLDPASQSFTEFHTDKTPTGIFQTIRITGREGQLVGFIGNTALTVEQMPKHSHSYSKPLPKVDNMRKFGDSDETNLTYAPGVQLNQSVVNRGANQTHTHSFSAKFGASSTMNFSVKYVDFIIAKKQ
jgi:hypothetical protein